MTPMDVPLISPVLPEIGTVFGVPASRAGLFIPLYALPDILLAPQGEDLFGVLAELDEWAQDWDEEVLDGTNPRLHES